MATPISIRFKDNLAVTGSLESSLCLATSCNRVQLGMRLHVFENIYVLDQGIVFYVSRESVNLSTRGKYAFCLFFLGEGGQIYIYLMDMYGY